VNLTNPMMMKGPLRELIPVGPQKVRLRLPEATRVRRAHLLTAGADVATTRSGDWVEFDVPQIVDHEVVALDL
jgi:hypothetical protein